MTTKAEELWGRGYGWPLHSDGHAYVPGDSQRDFHAAESRFKGLFGGRGSGKTTGGAQEALKRISRGLDGAVLNPDFENFKFSTWPEFRRWIPWHHVIKKNQYMGDPNWSPSRPFTLGFDTGAVVWCKGLKEADSARGPNINWLWYDEGGRDKKGESWAIAIGGVRIGQDPQAWTTSTPRGRRHWMYRHFVLQDIPPEALELLRRIGYVGDLYWYKHVTIHDNKHNLDPLFYASMLASYQGWFAEQELEGLFVEATEGLVYYNFGPHNISTEADFSLANGPIEVAFDDGYSQNPRVFLFLQRGDDGIIRIFDELYHRRHLSKTCVQEGKRLVNRYVDRDVEEYLTAQGIEYNPETYLEDIARIEGDEYAERVDRIRRIAIAVGDPSAAELRGAFRQENVAARGAKCGVVEGIRKTMNFVQDTTGKAWIQIHPRCKNLIYEMSEGYQNPEGTRSGSGVNPLKEDDHGPDALRYWVHLRGGRGR